ncbi:MAG: NAD-dependent epimerase/dehydratase family protein, partial [Gordonibacter urolithinfaciens]
MRVLVTGAKGFVGRNLCESLKAVRDGKDRRPRYAPLLPLEVWEHDRGSSPEDLDAWCAGADFVFNLAGVNRPDDPAEFMEGNLGFASELLGLLERHGNACPVMLASSAQASLEGRYAGSEYGRSKLAGEELFRDHSERTGAKVLVYRFPNLYGKWCRPNYNSAVATFCHNVARGLPVR